MPSVERRHRKRVAMATHGGGHPLLIGKDRYHRAALRQRIHEPLALGDQLRAVLCAEHFRNACCGVLPNAVPE